MPDSRREMGIHLPVLRYGKPSGPLLEQKASFFRENDNLQSNRARICALYTEQPKRERCINCNAPLRGLAFEKLKVEYVGCANCGHLNGAHEETDTFCAAVYTDERGASYAREYSSKDQEAYDRRVSAIYQPKAQFLTEVLQTRGEDVTKLAYADFGSGSGYFVAALLNAGVSNVTGYEVSEHQLALARQMTPRGHFVHHALSDVTQIARTVQAQVVSMIGVLEHLQRPQEMLQSICSNPQIRYVYISVPMFSFSVYLEAASPEVFHRQLGAGHTHLYTESSLNWMCKAFGFERVGEWWFGTDIVDLLRHIGIKLGKNPGTEELVGHWYSTFSESIDALQLQLDRRRQSSEVHLVLRCKR